MQHNINLILDFDGTLVNSLFTVLKNFNLLAEEFHFKKIDLDHIDHLRDLTSKELIKHFNIPLYKIPRIIVKARELVSSEIKFLPPIANLCDVLQEIYNLNIHLGILTSNSLDTVTEWLKCNNISDFFTFIHAESSYFGKKRGLKKMIRLYKMDREHTYYVGDETRDIDAAKKCGIKSIAVTWGFNSERILAECQPHFVARKPEDLLAILKAFQFLV